MKKLILLLCCVSGWLCADTKDPATLQRACDGGVGQACHILGRMYRDGEGVERDYKKAMEDFTKACDHGFALGCSFMGGMYYEGIGVKQDDNKAREYYKKACNLGLKQVCGLLG